MREYTSDERTRWLSGQHKIPASAIVAIEDSSERLLVVKATYKAYWSTPGGVIDANESPKRAALREVEEEVGLIFEAEELEFVGVTFRSGDFLDTYQFIFSARVSDEMATTITLQEDEIADYAFVSKREVLEDSGMYAPIVVRWAKGAIASYSEETVKRIE